MVCKMEHIHYPFQPSGFTAFFPIFQFKCKHDTLARYGRRFRYWLKTSPSINKKDRIKS